MSEAAAAQKHADASESDPIDILASLEPKPGGMTSDRAARLALERSPAVASARAATLSAEEEAGRTKLQLLPRLDLSGNYQRYPDLTQPDFDFGGMTFASPFPFLVNRYSFQADLRVGVTDIFLRILPSYKAARAQVDMARYQTDAERLSTAFSARQAFYDVVLAESTRIVADDSVRVLQANVDDIEALAQAGMVTQADVQRAKAQLANVKVRRARAEANLQVARAAFRQLVAGGESVETRSGEDLVSSPEAPLPDAETLVKTALEERPELLALQALVEAQQHAARARRAEMAPRLSLYGNATYARPNQLIIPPVDEFRRTWYVGAQLSWSPNDILTGRRSKRSGEALVVQAQEDLRNLRDGVIVEVAQAVSNHRAAAEAIEASREGLDAAELSYSTRRDLLKAGEATASELLEAETDLREAQLALVQAHVTLRRSLAAIDAAIGHGLPDEGPLTQRQ